ncbi:TSC22 domain family protein 1 isoform X3 [Corvus moneduloides]|uniref:TSC22 domain family protein 1 isoform X3 n=1 Tax=Corvus moneduloides TaxID=1196302 RepID=UPI0013632F6B|nr:TSC22 domain family protein 1 isoform X3 [Corvus moneduloides]
MPGFCAARRSADPARSWPSAAPQGPAGSRPRLARRSGPARTHASGRSETRFFFFFPGSVSGRGCMNAQCCRPVAMDLGVYQLRHFSISFLSSLLGTDNSSLRLDSSSSGASVVAIDNKIEQAMDLVKSHLMYAVREEVEVLKEQIKELIEKNSQLEQENTLLKTLASPEQLAQFQAQLQTGSPPSSSQSQGTTQQPAQPASQGSGPSA